MTEEKRRQTGRPGDRRRLVSGRFGGVLLWIAVLQTVFAATRVAIAVTWADQLSWDASMGLAWAIGLALDVLTAWLLALPLVVYLALLPQRVFSHPAHRAVVRAFFAISLFAATFVAVAEWVFWEELGTRFNFIAVDYLIFTYEVVGNIWQSYPMPAILGGLALLSALGYLALQRAGLLDAWLGSTTSARRRLATGTALVLVPLAAVALVDERHIPAFANTSNRELAKNGVFSFCAALRSQELDYETFYLTMPEQQALAEERRLSGADLTSFRSADPLDFVHRIEGRDQEERWNVVLITVESLSAGFLGAFGNQQGLTPNLDRVAADSLFFTHAFATGTRTTRGLEALTLSLPPTPGRSLLRRPDSGGLYNLSSLFRSRGYDTAFLYGGFSRFEAMKEFYLANGYRVVDRGTVPSGEVSFATIWGACDEDLYRWTLAEADRDHAAGKPFYFMLMTTSNHRPYTYPAGRTDIPSHSGRKGAVKYTDFALGELLRQAATRPWFDHTLFVVVADHTASSSGRAELEVRRFRIPLLFYNPGLVRAARVDTLCSQADVAPTLLGLLGWTYDSTFFGRDVLAEPPAEGRAYLGSYQQLALLAHDRLAILAPTRASSAWRCDDNGEHLERDAPDPALLRDAVASYESAYLLYRAGRLREELVTKPNRLTHPPAPQRSDARQALAERTAGVGAGAPAAGAARPAG